MTKLYNISRRFIPAILAVMTSAVAFAQDYYYEDDIYYDPGKAKKKEQKVQPKKQTTPGRTYTFSSQPVADYPAADSYTLPASSLNVDVDTYNRRGQFLVPDSVKGDKPQEGDFAYTQRIERFHNPSVVSGSTDRDLQEVYAYAMQQPQNVNIYVIDNDPWDYWGPGWSTWNWRYRNPWYWSAWGPSWSWGYDPYWSWSWGPSWSWSWGPAWSWGPSWGYPGYYPGPSHAWRPSTPSGSYRPHPSVGTGAYRPGSTRPSGSGSVTNRPGNMGRGRYGVTTNSATSPSYNSTVTPSNNTRPGGYRPSARPGSSDNSSSRPGNMGRGRSSYDNSNYNSGYRSPSNNNAGSFSRPGNSGSRGSFGGGSFGGGSYGGGSNTGGISSGTRGRR